MALAAILEAYGELERQAQLAAGAGQLAHLRATRVEAVIGRIGADAGRGFLEGALQDSAPVREAGMHRGDRTQPRLAHVGLIEDFVALSWGFPEHRGEVADPGHVDPAPV